MFRELHEALARLHPPVNIKLYILSDMTVLTLFQYLSRYTICVDVAINDRAVNHFVWKLTVSVIVSF